MKAIIPLVILIAAFLYIGKFHVTLKPFSVSLPDWISAIGYALFIIGFILILADTSAKEHHKGVMKGIDDSYDAIHKVLDDMLGKENIDAIKTAVKETAEAEKEE